MNDKQKLLTLLREELNRWEEMLRGKSEAQLTARQPDSGLSIKDIVGHLRAWQQVSIARLEAALHDHEPEYPDWVRGDQGVPDPDAEEYLEVYNARIHAIYRDQSWPDVHRAWRDGFLRFLELAEAIPAEELFVTGRHAWLEGYPLAAVLEGSYGHHEEHLEPFHSSANL